MKINSKIFLVFNGLLLIVLLNSCGLVDVNYKELKIMEGEWEVTSHKFTFFIGQNSVIETDTILSETGVFKFKKENDYGGSYTFTASTENRPVSPNYAITSYNGTYELTDLKTCVDIMLYPEGGGFPYKNIKIVDFGKRDQVWYADKSLNSESGANEVLYVDKK